MLAEGYKETEIGVVPEDWEIVKLKNILTIGSGKDYKHLDKGDIPVYGTGGFMLSVNKYLYDGESVCIGRKGTIDKPMFLTGKFWTVDTLFYTHLFKGVKPKFLYYLFLQIDWKKYNEASGVPSLSKKTIEVIQIPFPPLKEQEKIANILSTADEKIDAIASQIQKTETLKKGLLQKLLSEGIGHSEFKDSELGKIPESWEVVNVENITDTHKQGYYTKDEYTGKGTYLIRITDLGNPKIDYSHMPMLPVSDNDYQSFKVSKGDFLFARSGAIGRYGIVYEDYNAVFASYLIRFTFHQGKVINEYFGYFYETKKAINQLLSITQGSSNININANNIKSIKLALPPLEEQKQIADILSTTDEKLEVLRAKKEKYEILKKGLLQKLLSGEVRV